ncbi:MAG: flippase [Ignavibacteriae bacterium]|nr:MAG: flippase [Ignavibacteriota bacterium]
MQNNIQKIVARNIAFLVGAQAITKGGIVIAILLLTNYLGVDEFGRYNFLLAYAALFTPLCDLGFDVFIVRHLAMHPEERGRVAGTVLSAKFILVLFSISLISISFYFVSGVPSLLYPMVLAAAVVTIRTITGTFSGLFRANQHLSLDSFSQIAAKLFDIAAVLVALFFKADLILLLKVLLVSALLQSGYSFFLAYRNSYLTSISFDATILGPLFKGAFPFALTSISVMIYFQIDVVMLSMLVNEHETGIYRSATNIVFGITAFSAAVVTALFPMIAKEYNSDRQTAVRTTSNAMFYSLLFVMPIAVFTTGLAGPIIQFLYRDSFAAASSSLRILVWWLPVAAITNILGYVLGAIGLQRKVLLISVMNAVFNVMVNFYFIPHFGPVGASITTVATELLGFVFLASIVRKHFGHVIPRDKFLRVACAALFILPLMVFGDRVNIILLGLASVAIYSIALFLCGAINKQDLKNLGFAIFTGSKR